MAGKNYFEMIRDGILVDGSGGGDAPAPVLIEKSVTENGTYTASSDNADGYSTVSVDVQPTLVEKTVKKLGAYNASDDNADGYSSFKVTFEPGGINQLKRVELEKNILYAQYLWPDGGIPQQIQITSLNSKYNGQVIQNGLPIAQTSTTATTNGTIDTTTNNEVVVAVPNTYVAGDEGKVVSNGALVAQGSDSVTENGTVDTTLISSLTVNVQGGGTGVPVKLTTTNEDIISSDLYIVDSGSYIYIYGEVVAPSGTGAKDIVFDIPPSFSIDTVGNLIETGYHESGTSNAWTKDRIRISKTSKCVYFNSSSSSSNPPSSSSYLKNTVNMFGIYEKI
jgi:hypothetical protein